MQRHFSLGNCNVTHKKRLNPGTDTRPVAEDREETKQTNEIGMFIPTFDQIDIEGKTITADVLDRRMTRRMAMVAGNPRIG